MRIPMFSAIAAGALALGGCAYGDLGMGLGYGGGYGGYGGGYGSYGYGSPYGGGYYGAGYGSPYGYGSSGYGSPYYGWYNNYYYPGTGAYVYDSYRRPYSWNGTQQSYWSARRPAMSGTTTTTRTVSPNWSTFNNRRAANTSARGQRAQAQQQRTDRATTRASTRDSRNPLTGAVEPAGRER
jgi:hypothetical protein